MIESLYHVHDKDYDLNTPDCLVSLEVMKTHSYKSFISHTFPLRSRQKISTDDWICHTKAHLERSIFFGTGYMDASRWEDHNTSLLREHIHARQHILANT